TRGVRAEREADLAFLHGYGVEIGDPQSAVCLSRKSPVGETETVTVIETTATLLESEGSRARGALELGQHILGLCLRRAYLFSETRERAESSQPLASSISDKRVTRAGRHEKPGRGDGARHDEAHQRDDLDVLSHHVGDSRLVGA